MTPPFAAVLLAGGRSQRMGRDKALLTLPDGRRLWERQRDVLQGLNPAEWFISGYWREGFPTDLPWLADEVAGCGPLAGIAAALKAMRSPKLIVLAVDLPAMTTDYLRGLLETNGELGMVPQHPDGFYEPLAAVYPQLAAMEVDERLHSRVLALQPFVRSLCEAGQAAARPIMPAESGLFANWNCPGDFSA